MRTIVLLALTLAVLLSVAGCGNHHHHPPAPIRAHFIEKRHSHVA